LRDFSLPKDLDDAARPALPDKHPDRYYGSRPHEPLSEAASRYDRIEPAGHARLDPSRSAGEPPVCDAQ
jgi:hypothetical protein